MVKTTSGRRDAATHDMQFDAAARPTRLTPDMADKNRCILAPESSSLRSLTPIHRPTVTITLVEVGPFTSP